jgi:hypothetical protein
VLLLGDGPKAVTRRYWLVPSIGVVGLMTSGVFLAVAVGCGVATLLRRGVRVAGFYGVPLGEIYLAWYVLYGRDSVFPVQLDGGAVRAERARAIRR